MGDKVEWIPDDEEPGVQVWWNRHQKWLIRIRTGKEQLTPDRKAVLKLAKARAKELEKQYGKANLGWNDFEWGILSGRMSALAWVMGMEWEESLDT